MSNPDFRYKGSNIPILLDGWNHESIVSNTTLGGRVVMGYSVAEFWKTETYKDADGKTHTRNVYDHNEFYIHGVISATTLQNGGIMDVHAGSVDNLTVEAGAVVSVFAPQWVFEDPAPRYDYKSAYLDPQVNNVVCGGKFVLLTGASAGNVVATGIHGELHVSSNSVLKGGGVAASAKMDVYNRGSAYDLAAEGGAVVNVAYGGTITNANITDSAVVNVKGTANAYIGGGGSAVVTDYGTLNGSVVDGGDVYVSQGGRVGFATDSEGKVDLENFKVYGGNTYVGESGRIGNVDVSGGYLSAMAGAIFDQTGTVTLTAGTGGVLVLDEKGSFKDGELQIDLTNCAGGNYIAVENFNNYNEGSFALAITADQTYGKYVLTAGEGWDHIKYSVIIDGMRDSKFTLGDIRVHDGKEYLFENDTTAGSGKDGKLYFTVQESAAKISKALIEGDKFSYQDNRFVHVGSDVAFLSSCTESGLFGYNSGLVASSYRIGSRASIVLGGSSYDFALLGADMRILSGGVANDTIISSGSLYISGGASAIGGRMEKDHENNILVAQRGYLANYDIQAGSVYVAAGGYASNVELQRNCTLTAQGVCSDVTISRGGIVRTEENVGVVSGVRLYSEGYLQGMQYIAPAVASRNAAQAGGMPGATGPVSSSDGVPTAFVEKVSGGICQGYIKDLQFSGTAQFGSTASATDLVLLEDAKLSAFDKAHIADVEINDGGVMFLTRDAVAEEVDVKTGGNVILSSGAMIRDATVASGALISAGATAKVKDITVEVGGKLNISGYDTTLSGNIDLRYNGSEAAVLNVEGTVGSAKDVIISLDFTERTVGDNVCQVNNINAIADARFTITVVPDMENGKYLIGSQGADFAGWITVKYADNSMSRDVSMSYNAYMDNKSYSLSADSFGRLYLSVEDGDFADKNDIVCNLSCNGVSQVVAWDAAQGKVGYVATTGQVAPSWAGIWEWQKEIDLDDGRKVAEKDLWRVAGVGHFKGSKVDYDGILLYNGIGNTFAAWTDLKDASYGYIDLCHVEGNFQTQCLTNLDGDEYDDVLIYNEKGSFGVVSGGTEWHSIWDAPADNVQQLMGAGNFGAADGMDSLLVKNTKSNAYYLWHNSDPTFATWDWTQTYIGTLDDDWTVAAIGDFRGDGTDDIVMWQKSTGYMFAWEDGSAAHQSWCGELNSSDWEVAAVGDYNGDGKEDLLLREMSTGWGGIGYWGAGYAGNWMDLNARIETDMESQFKVIA